FFGAQLKTITHYGYDEQNSKRQRQLLINVGGGSPATGQVAGIHWHMNIANEVTYISTDDHRQVIPWVRIKDRQGRVTEYFDRTVVEIQRIFQTYFFPEMRTDWQTHPNNIGHLYFSGCFRCHDGEHVSNDGKVITNNCNVCHTLMYDSARPAAENAKVGPF